MTKLQVYDPPMCCSTGVCGPNVDPVLPQFVADLHWLVNEGVAVERYNLAQDPQAFAANEAVKNALSTEGNECLPLIVVNGIIASRARYPSRDELARLTGLAEKAPASVYTEAIAELVAIGAAIASNCEVCLKYHYDRARKLGVSNEDMERAVKTAQSVKESPARSILELADRLLGRRKASASLPVIGGCCGLESSQGKKAGGAASEHDS